VRWSETLSQALALFGYKLTQTNASKQATKKAGHTHHTLGVGRSQGKKHAKRR
jgi:hypothetical protein